MGRKETNQTNKGSISTKVWSWDRARIELVAPRSAVRDVSAARHVTDCATWPSDLSFSDIYLSQQNVGPNWNGRECFEKT